MENWKVINGYENLYLVSDFGNVKSLDRIVNRGLFLKPIKGCVLKQNKDGFGYLGVDLCKDGNRKRFKVHQLVAVAFLNHTPEGFKSVVDHIDNDRTNNKIENLQIITMRKNCSKDKKNKTSLYAGVSLISKTNKWRSIIRIKGKSIHLGNFDFQKDAGDVYQKAVVNIDKYNGDNYFFRQLLVN